MGFLDNSGDIILDAVLTDTGRQRLSRGDGSFRISKFALGDDEVNYGLYNKEHPSGSAYYDLEILQTPIFEAFTNNIASLNSRLTSFSRTNLLYLPVLKVNYDESKYADQNIVKNGYILAVDVETEKFFSDNKLRHKDSSAAVSTNGLFYGINTSTGAKVLRVDQGIDNKESVIKNGLDSDLVETQYLIEMDNRFMSLIAEDGSTVEYSYLDDDDMAAYYSSTEDVPQIVMPYKDATNENDTKIIAGAKGTTMRFKLRSSAEVSSTDYLFDKLGTDITSNLRLNNSTLDPSIVVKSINTSVRITGLSTGYAIDIPVVLVKVI